MIDYHIHLERGPYKEAWLNEFIKVGKSKAIEEFGIVEHLYIFKEASELLYKNKHVDSNQTRNISNYFNFLTKMKKKYNLSIGIEVDYTKKFEAKTRKFIKDLPVDYLIGSVHYLNGWAFDLDSDWQDRNIEEVYSLYYARLLEAAQSEMFDILGHPGNIKYYGHRTSLEFENKLVRAFYKGIARLDIVVEVNSGGLYRPAGEVFPELRWLKLLRELDIELTCSSDAHDPKHTGFAITEQIIPALKAAGYNRVVRFKNRKKIYKKI